MRLLSLLLLSLLVSGCLSFGLSRDDYCSKAWRWDLECALNFTLSDEEVVRVRGLSEELRGKDCVESSWNILDWVEENIEYDSYKAMLPSPTIVIRGKEVTIQNPERVYQTPFETLRLKKGICGDYAILTFALLRNLECTAYILKVDFEKEEIGHLATIILADQYYVLDQKLPPMDLGSYYKKWLREGKKITKVHIYDKGLLKASFNSSEINKFDYKITESDLRFLENKIREVLRQRLNEDPRIPSGYWEYAKLKITFQNYAELYTPLFSEKIAEKIAKGVMRSVEETNKKWRVFKLDLMPSSTDLIVEVQLAR